MDTRNAIEKRIEREKQSLNDLKSQIAKSESFILGLQEALKLLPEDKEARRPRARKSKLLGIIRPGSEIEKVYQLLKSKGKPMHISDLITGIGKEDTKANRMSLTGSLGRYVRNKNIFTRVGPNLFSLIEITNTGPKALELPPEFGVEK